MTARIRPCTVASILLVSVLLAACDRRRGHIVAPIIHFELRLPVTATIDPQTTVGIVSRSGESATQLSACSVSNDGGFRCFHQEFVLSSEADARRGIYVTTFPGTALGSALSQVFVLTIPKEPKEMSWTQWQRPDYVETGAAAWTFSTPDDKVKERSRSIPASSFELRYQIVNTDLGEPWHKR